MIISSRARRAAQKQLKLAAQWVAFALLGSFAVVLAAMFGEVLSPSPVSQEAFWLLVALGSGIVSITAAIGWLCSVMED